MDFETPGATAGVVSIITQVDSMRYPMMIIVVIIGAYAMLCLLAFVFQDRLVFFPDRALVTTPAAAGFTYKDVMFRTEDNLTLHGWYIPADNEKFVLLFCHGNAGNISHRLDSIAIFRHLGLSVFIFDYRGYGNSEGRISEQGTYLDARAAYRYLALAEKIDSDRIIFFGRSLGAAVAAELATHHRPRALIAESSFPSMGELGQRVYPFLPVRWLARIKYDSKSAVGRMDFPKLFIHSRQDDIVPYSLGKQLFETAAEPKQLLEISGSHNEGFIQSQTTYVNGLREFIHALE